MNFEFNLKELLSGDVNRLRYIMRFGTAFTAHKESVAEHTFYVAIYSLFLAKWANDKFDGIVRVEKVLEKALLHDLEECRTGDFPRPFKYRRPDLKKLLDNAAQDEFNEIVVNILPGKPETAVELTKVWSSARDNTPEGCIVALADYLSVVSHLWQELHASNLSMAIHFDTMTEYLHEFDAAQYNFLREIIQETQDLMYSLFDKFSDKVKA